MTKLIIIDDSPEERAYLSELAGSNGAISVASFATGRAALVHYETDGADCILIDHRLAGEDGLEILAEFRKRSSHLPVLLMSGHVNEELLRISIETGATNCLSKVDLARESLSGAIFAAVKQSADKPRLTSADDQIRRILLIEDNDDDRNHIADMISNPTEGLEVEALATGPEALAFFSNNQVACTILDYRLEAEDGLDLLAKLKSISPFHPVIMLTGQGNEEVAATSIKAGASDYLIKQRLTRPYLKTAIENAISRAQLEAKVAEQEMERRQFLNILVHDLRAPLRNVRSLGEFAAEEAAIGNVTEMGSLLETQSSVAKRANDLIDALEIYALLDGQVKFEPVSLAAVVQAAKSNLALTIQDAKAEILVGPLSMVNGHQPQLVQLFQNIIQNGIKYNDSPRPTIRFEWRNGDTVVIRDNGIGIPEKFQKTIFAPLKRLWNADQYDGTGLGLATCQKIVERHGGVIWCAAPTGVGTEFHIRFPVVHRT